MQAKLLRLEKEAVEHDRTKEELRVALARAAELDKSNKKHYEQAHVDKKTIIKLTEVRMCIHIIIIHAKHPWTLCKVCTEHISD